MLRQILQQYREGQYNRDKGDAFERLICAYLKTDPQYQALFSSVCLWKNWEEREALGYKLPDTGIDLVAKFRDGSGYCAIQCKFYETAVAMSDLGNFFTLSGKGGFTQRLIIATAPLTKHAADALDGQTIPVSIITLEDLEAAPVDWAQFSIDAPEKLTASQKKSPRPHQQEALDAVVQGFASHERGKLIMACGTGKTYTSLIIAEKLVERGGVVLFLVPSIALLSQTLRAWTADATVPLRCFAVCSDSKASRNEEDMRIAEMAYPATTDAAKLAQAFQQTQDPDALTVIFSTYQSIAVVHEAQVAAGFTFDLVICDEAHRTAGYTVKGEDHSAFVRVHDADYIRGKKRLYMTATPKLYAEASKAKAKQTETEVFSMDDAACFGPEFHRLRFDEAVRRGLLSDYKVLVLAVDERFVSHALAQRLSDESDELKLDDAVKIVGCWRGLAKKLAQDDSADKSADPTPMRTAIAFAATIKHSKQVAKEFSRIANDLQGAADMPVLEAEHVDGSMNVVERNKKLSWLKDNVSSDAPVCRILSNARCLSEGVDVPALDAAIFLNPRDSVVEVVQSVGRVMRKAPGKQYGYVIIPIGISMGSSPEKALDNNKKYRVIWQVLNALRAHDERLDRQFARIDLLGKDNKVVEVIGVTDDDDKADRPQWLPLPPAPGELEEWQNAIFGKIVHKCGDRLYWETWAKDIATIADLHQTRIRTMLEHPTAEQRRAFDTFLHGLQNNINPGIDEAQGIEMLAQHIITKPVFDALFEGYAFTEHNPVSQSMQAILDVLKKQALDKEQDKLEGFYASIRERVSDIHDPAARQKIILELYQKFFKTAFPKMVERLGIVYTPVEVVDFIIRSADKALQKHFHCRLQDEGVHILDPFTGTGTFPVRLLESGVIPPDRLAHKYRHELHANEIVLLAYYIAAINVEEAFHRITGNPYEPFPGICLTDTFQLNETDGKVDIGLPQNIDRVNEQKARDIRVIVSNPPYSAGQKNANDNNQNLKYPRLDSRIAATYAAHSTATLQRKLYDSYIRAFRWASDRIGTEGIVCFVTNGAWLDRGIGDGFRHELEREFSAIYVFNLRGDQRTSGELSHKEGGKIFGSGSRAPIAITLLVKKDGHSGKAVIRYHDIGDYLTQDAKLAKIAAFGDYTTLPWTVLQPNENDDWINQRNAAFSDFVPLNDDEKTAIFYIRSLGSSSNRDAWCYNYSNIRLCNNIKNMILVYNNQCDIYINNKKNLQNNNIEHDSKKIKWSANLKSYLHRNKIIKFSEIHVRYSTYRPYTKQYLYADKHLIERPGHQPNIFPTPSHKNLTIQVTGIGVTKDFSCLILNTISDIQAVANGQCFPLYYYEKADSGKQGNLLEIGQTTETGYVRKEAVTDAGLELFRNHYEDDSISKEDLFYYVYGVLHSPKYREDYAADLKKTLPRVPLAPDFWAFSKAGRELAHWHLDYESVEPWPVEEERQPQGDKDDFAYYHVEKMRFPKKGEKGSIIFNPFITFKNIPLEAYDYVVNGKSALEWIMERYAATVDKDSGIRNDPNDWCREHNDPRYIYNLVKRIIRVSMETNKIVAALPDYE